MGSVLTILKRLICNDSLFNRKRVSPMINKIFQKLIVFTIILFPLVHHNTIFASELSEEGYLIRILLHEDNKDFLNNLIVSTYEEGKSDPELQKKMCTHSDTIVQAWKDFTKKAPSTLSQKQWDDTIGRKEIYVFTTPDPLALLDEHVNKPLNITHETDNMGSIALYVDYAIGKTIGEKYTDTTTMKGKRKKAVPEEAYKKEELKSIRVIIKIKQLIDTMKKRQQLGEKGQDIFPESFVGLANIASICPQG